MKYFWTLLALTGLVIVQSTLLAALFPRLPLAPALVFLMLASLRFERGFFLIAALWAGLVQDILLGEFFGFFMLLNFNSAVWAWEIRKEWLDNLVLTGGLRLIAATLLQEVFAAFFFYIRGITDLAGTLQINAGKDLLFNLLIYAVFLLALKIRHRGSKLEAVLGAKL